MNIRKSFSLLALSLVSLLTAPAVNAQTFYELPGHLYLDFGFNFLEGNPSQLNTTPLRSPAWGGQYMYPFQLNEGSAISVNAGLGISQNMYSFANEVLPLYDTVSGDPQGLIFDTVSQVLPASNVDVSQIGVIYANLPIEVRWDLKPGSQRNSFWVAVGGSIGYRIGAFSKVRYTTRLPIQDTPSEDRVLTRRESWLLNPLRYGAHIRVGYDWIHAYGRYEFSPLWDPVVQPATPNGSSWQVGISVDLF